MKTVSMLRAAALVVMASLCTAALAQPPQGNGQTFQPNLPAGQQIGVTSAPAPIIVQSAPSPAPAVIDTGTAAGQGIVALVAAFGTGFAGLITTILIRFLTHLGMKNADQLSDRLDDIIVRGLNAGAHALEEDLKGKGKVEVHNELAAYAVQYAQKYGADVIKKLGDDPNTARAVAAINARIATVVADPAQPTPAVLDAPGAPKPPVIAADVTVKS